MYVNNLYLAEKESTMKLRRIHPKGAWMKLTDPARMARLRKRRDYTQSDLSSLVGCTQQYISAMETGADTDCSERIALEICRRLDVDLEDLFRDVTAPSLPSNERMERTSTRRSAA
ncbi:XRE family transcriptional regulator [Acidipropionibacterium acidipropionici]|nr:XRE family transcriptional regulator [Acidipropionibacterium acidipropionici]